MLLVAIIIIIPLGGYVALKALDMNDFKPQLEALAEKYTGRKTTIEGDIEIAVGLTPTLKMHGIVIANSEWGKAPALLKAGTVAVTTDLMPLLRKQLLLRTLEMDGITLYLEASGKKKNWNILSSMDKAKQEAKTGEPPEAKSERSVSAVLGDLDFKNIAIVYDDGKRKKPIRVSIPQVAIVAGDKVDIAADMAAGSLKGDLRIKAANLDALIGGVAEIAFHTKDTPDLDFSMEGKFSELKTPTPDFDMQVKAEGKNLMAFAPLTSTPMPEIPPFSFSGHLKGSSKKITVPKFSLKMDGTSINGNATIKTGNTPYVSAVLTIPEITIPKSEKKVESKPFVLETKPLASADADLDYTIGKLIYGDLVLSDMKGKAHLKDGVLDADPLSFMAAGGEVKAGLHIRHDPSSPDVRFRLGTDNVMLGQLLRQLGTSDNIRDGNTTVSLKGSASGKTQDALLASLDGSAKLFVGDAVYEKPPALAKAGDFLNLLKGGSGSSEINLTCIAAKFDIADGNAKSEYMMLETNSARVAGKGSINLAAKKLNLTLSPSSKTVGLADLVVPVVVKGKWTNPTIAPDPAGTAVTIGKVAASFTGVGLAAVLGESFLDKTGVTRGENHCAAGSAIVPAAAAPAAGGEASKPEPENAKEYYEQEKDAVKKNIKNIEDDVRDQFKIH